MTYKVNADYELRFATIATLNLCQSVLVGRVAAHLGRTVPVSLLLHWVARRCWLLVHLLLVRRRIRVTAASVDGWGRQWACWPALTRMRRAEITGAGVSVLV